MNGGAGLWCRRCALADPPPSMTCRLRRDHRIGTAAGCPGCGRLMAACGRRPCSAWPRERASGRPPGQAGEDRALQALDLAWGDTYDLWARGGRYLARRADGTGEPLAGDTADDLIQALRADRAREGAP
jgi:hypothetical protein